MADRRGEPALPAHRASRRAGVRCRRAQLSPNQTPGRLPGIVDAHCHLQAEAFDPDRAAVIERARAAGIGRLLVPGYDLPSSHAAVALARTYPDLIHAAVGVHPHYAARVSASEWGELTALAREPGVVAIGEIGLDYFRNLSPPDAQRDAFARQLDLAAAARKPVIVHDREAHADIASRLRRWATRQSLAVPGVMHAFSGDAPMAADLASAGFLVSFALPLTFRSAIGPREAATNLPASQVLVETDAPWLAPGGSGERNEPTTVLRVAAELARLRDASPESIASSVRVAYERFVAASSTPAVAPGSAPSE